MPDITKIKIGNERERSYKDFPANREFKKRAEDDNPGGGGWPSDLPKPSVGGYGYTEQGEQTVITWDGDTEGRDSIMDSLFKVSDDVPNDAEISSGVVVFDNGESGIVGSGFQIGDTAMAYVDGSLVVASAPGQIVTTVGTFDIPSAGVYFPKMPNGGFIASLTYGTPDTIHKIDEKYLPASGGVQTIYANGQYFVFDENDVDIDFDSEDERFVSYADILRMFNSGVVRADMQNSDISTITNVSTNGARSGCRIGVAGYNDDASYSRDYVKEEK